MHPPEMTEFIRVFGDRRGLQTRNTRLTRGSVFVNMSEKSQAMKAFGPQIVSFLQEDANVIKYGYRNYSTSSSKIEAYTLIVDGEASCKLKRSDANSMIEACQHGPWMNVVKKVFPSPHLLAMEVQMNGSVEDGAWHFDSTKFRIMTIVVPLNDAYHKERGGCTEVFDDKRDTTDFIQCSGNEYRIFDGSFLHRRTGASSQKWASERRMVFLHFADSKRPWHSVSGARVAHTKMSRRARLMPARTVPGTPRRSERIKEKRRFLVSHASE